MKLIARFGEVYKDDIDWTIEGDRRQENDLEGRRTSAAGGSSHAGTMAANG